MVIPSALKAKLDWADHHFSQIKAEFSPYWERHAYRHTYTITRDFKEHIFHLVFDEPAPSERWGLMFADAIQNLRSALDHTVFAVAVKEAGTENLTERQERRLQFPVVETPDDWDAAAWHVDTLSEPVRTLIQGLQPGIQDPVHSGLFLTDKLSNIGKHRALQIVGSILAEPQIRVSGARGGIAAIRLSDMPLDSGAPIINLFTEEPSPDMKVHDLRWVIDPMLEVRDDPDDPQAVRYYSLSDIRGQCRKAVRRTVNRLCKVAGLDEP